MDKRIFVCADRSFPRGDAGANRILFMAKALVNKGWEAIVISIGKNDKKYYSTENKCYVYEGVKYLNVKTSNNRYIRMAEHNLFDGKRACDILTSFHACSTDKILLYSSNYTFSKSILDYSGSKGIKVACDIVEWHQPFQAQFPKGEKDFRYKQYKRFFEELVPSSHNVIAISEYLNKHFVECGCNTITLPIYVDTDSRGPFSKKKKDDTIHFIYPGDPRGKDDLLSMVGALCSLDKEERKRIRFHLTGASKSRLLECVPGQENKLESLIKEGTIIVHSWMKYEDLMDLYETVDFALLAREITIVTLANFPSKVPELLNKGIPVVINRVGDIANYLTDGKDAILYDGKGTEACLQAVRRVLSLSQDERYEMSKNAYDNARIVFDYHLCEDKLDSFFKTLV